MKKFLIIISTFLFFGTSQTSAFDLVSSPTSEQNGGNFTFNVNNVNYRQSNICGQTIYTADVNYYLDGILYNSIGFNGSPLFGIYDNYYTTHLISKKFNKDITSKYSYIYNLVKYWDGGGNCGSYLAISIIRSKTDTSKILKLPFHNFFINEDYIIEVGSTQLKYWQINDDTMQLGFYSNGIWQNGQPLQTLNLLNGFIPPNNSSSIPLYFEDLILSGIDTPKNIFIYQGNDNNIHFWTIDNGYFGNITDGGFNSKVLGKILTPLSINSFLFAGQNSNSGTTFHWQGSDNNFYTKNGNIRTDLIIDKITTFENPNLFLKTNLGLIYKWDLRCLNVPYNSCQLDVGQNKFFCTDSSGNKDPNNIECGIEIEPPTNIPFPNQDPPEDYIAVYNRETDLEDKRKGNCLYTTVDSDFFTKPIQFCRVDDYIEIKENRLYDSVFCPAGSKFYFNGIVGYGQYYIVNGLCSTKNDKTGIVDMKINDLSVQPYATYKSIVPFSTLWTSGSLSGSTRISNQSIVQTYGSEFDLDNSWKNDFLLSSFPLLKQNESIMINVSSNSDSNDVGFNFIYYTDLNYYLNSTIVDGCSFIDSFIKFQECSSNMINSKTRLIDLSSGDYVGDYTNATGSTIDNLYTENPPDLLNQFPDSIGTEKDNEIFNCNFNNLSWYEYIGSPFLCLFQIAENIYNKGALMVDNVSYFLQQLFNVGADKTDTKNIFSFLFIEKAHAETGFLNIADGLGDVYNGNGIGGKIGFILRYFIYSLIFLMVIVLFLTYKKK